MDFRVGFGYDSHRFGEGRELWIGGIRIPHSKGCIAHSDGDVLIHALIDALLGALALKDIGTHFPDHDPSLKNIDSKVLLQKTITILHDLGWKINNADISVILEQPKLSPFIDEMLSVLLPILQIDSSRLSIKAKTNEKMGFTGREEGIAAYTVVSLVKE